MKTILITAIAGDVAQAVATIIRETFPDWYLIGCDIHSRHGAELFVNKWYVAPRADSPDYYSWIESLVVRENVDICLPMSEAEIIFFAKAGVEKIANTNLLMPNLKAIEVGSDKLATAKFLTAIGCSAPWTILPIDCNPGTPFPCIFKPRRGAGSKGVFVCHTIDEALFLNERYPDGILQELLLPEEQEVTCAIYRTRDGRTAVLQLLRRLVGGSTGWAKVIKNKDISCLCERLALELDLEGSINVQLRVTNEGPRVFEINPRFSSTVRMRHLMGYQDVIWALKEMEGERIELFIPQEGTIGIRYQQVSILNAQ